MGTYTLRNRYIKQRIRNYINVIKGGGCVLCGEKKISLLTFHHIDMDDKEYKISDLIAHRKGGLLVKEIKKCVVLCNNCHIKVHKNNKLYGYLKEKYGDKE